MDEILKTYKEKLDNEIVDIKSKLYTAKDVSEEVDNIREELSTWGKSNLSLLFLELKSYVEAKNPDFIKNNPDRWKEILDKANALTEYGLYVAPIDLFRDKIHKNTPAYIGFGGFVGGVLFSKLILKKSLLFTNLFISSIAALSSNFLFNSKSHNKELDFLIGYINDAKDWINTAFENMVRTFEEAM